MPNIYLDNAGTTAIDPLVSDTVCKVMKTNYANPGSSHLPGQQARKILGEARFEIAGVVNCKPEEIYFTAGGTEANNIAILGTASTILKSIPYHRMHMITSVIEHSSVLECFRYLETLGVSVDYIKPDAEGVISLEEIKNVLKPNTVLVSVMYANNEIGTIQPIRKISLLLKACKSDMRPIFHTDACQAPLYLDVNKETLGVDLMSFDAHKIYGPKGIGGLYISKSAEPSPIIYGGGQEKSIRPGTENLPLIVGFAKAMLLATERRKKDSAGVAKLRNYFLSVLRKLIPELIVNGAPDKTLPNLLNISLPGMNADLAVIRLSAKGVYCSSKSVCRGEGKGSYVISAIGKKEFSHSSLRLSLGRLTKKSEIDYTTRLLYELWHEGLLCSE